MSEKDEDDVRRFEQYLTDEERERIRSDWPRMKRQLMAKVRELLCKERAEKLRARRKGGE